MKTEPKSGRKGKYRVGQVVRIDVPYYKNGDEKSQMYQRITKITLWGNQGLKCLSFLNGDECHEKWVKPLTDTERGRKP